MDKCQFDIKILDLYWLDKTKDDPDDLCLHGDVYVKIGEEVIVDKYSCTVSSTGLYLLKSLENDHIIGENSNQMLPCCGFFIITNEKDDNVDIIGCPHGIDWTVLHSGDYIKLITQKGTEVTVKLNSYREVVYRFVDVIKEFYKKSTPKNMTGDSFDIIGYIKFWDEWDRRRNAKI